MGSILTLTPLWLGPSIFAGQVMEITEVGLGWAAHKTSSPILVTADDHQYTAYYDDERRLTLAWRRVDQPAWKQRKFPVVTRWATGAHAMIALTVDMEGIIHLIPYRRDLSEAPASPPEIIYYRSACKHDPESMERSFMVSPEEPHPHYPVFLKAADGGLFFESRIGSSGKGNQMLYRQDRETGEWHRLSTLLDGQGRMSAYGGPRLGPDGRWHCLWMWRNTSDAATNHTLSYMVSPDLQQWTNAAGEPLELPIHPEHPQVVIDAARPGEGMINPLKSLSFDSQQRPIATYHKYAPCGNSAIYNARFEDGAWKSVAAHVWDHRWNFGGGGAVDMQIGCGPVTPVADGRLVQRVWSKREGALDLTLDEETLTSLGAADDAGIASDSRDREWQRKFGKPEIDFKDRPLQVSWLEDQGVSGENGIRYIIRWEHGPVNIGDRAVPEPWPPGAPLRVFKVR